MAESDIHRRVTPPSGTVIIQDFDPAVRAEFGDGSRYAIGPRTPGGHQVIYVWLANPGNLDGYPPTVQLQLAIIWEGREADVEFSNGDRATVLDPMAEQRALPVSERLTMPPSADGSPPSIPSVPKPEVKYLAFVSLERFMSERPDRFGVCVITVEDSLSQLEDAAPNKRLYLQVGDVQEPCVLLPTEKKIV